MTLLSLEMKKWSKCLFFLPEDNQHNTSRHVLDPSLSCKPFLPSQDHSFSSASFTLSLSLSLILKITPVYSLFLYQNNSRFWETLCLPTLKRYAFISYCCYNKVSQTQCLKHKFPVLQFWYPEVWNESYVSKTKVHRSPAFLLEVPGENPLSCLF